MKVTVDLDDGLLGRAGELTGIKDGEALVRMGLEALISRSSIRRLAELGGSEPSSRPAPRRRPGSSA